MPRLFRFFARGVQQDKSMELPDLAAEVRARLVLYESGRAYRERP